MTVILKDRLRELMSRKKINAAQIERKSGLNRNTVYSILGGHSKSPSMHNLQLLAKALDINLEVLTGNKEEDANLEILTASQVKIFADITNIMTKIIIEQNANLSIGKLTALIKEAYEYSIQQDPPIANDTFVKWVIKNRDKFSN